MFYHGVPQKAAGVGLVLLIILHHSVVDSALGKPSLPSAGNQPVFSSNLKHRYWGKHAAAMKRATTELHSIVDMIHEMEKLSQAPRPRYLIKTAPKLDHIRDSRDYYRYKEWFKEFQKEQEQWCGLPTQELDAHQQPDFHPADIKSWPWMVSLFVMPEELVQLLRELPLEEQVLQDRLYGFISMFICGGSLLSTRFVLTAAHCLHRKELRHGSLALSTATIEIVNICMDNRWTSAEKVDHEQICAPLKKYLLNKLDLDLQSYDPHIPETWKVYIGTHDMRYNLSRLQLDELPDDNPHMSLVIDEITPETSDNFQLLKNSGFTDDVAVLVLEKPVQYSVNARPVCLPNKLEKNLKECAVAGWGIGLEFTKPLASLQQAGFSIIKDSKCQKQTKDYFEMRESRCEKVNIKRKICAIRNDVTLPVSRSDFIKNSLREGDSGGPLVCRYKDKRWYQVGIVSYGNQEVTDRVLPDVFTRVPAYTSWIINTMWSQLRSQSMT